MTTKFFERIASVCSSLVQRKDEGARTAENPAGSWSPPAEDRVQLGLPCTYVICESLEDQSLVVHEGEGTVLNVGPGDMLVRVREEIARGQIVEVRVDAPKFGPTLSLLETSWTRLLSSEREPRSYLAQGRFLFGPYAISERRVLNPADLTEK